MTQQDRELTVAQRLGQLLDRGLLPAGGPAEAAERLIERLERPARIALLGLPGAGKSAVLNLLCGTVVVPENLRLPTIIVQHRAEDRMLCTLADGRTQAVPGHDLAQILTLNPALVTLERDLPALKVISLLEVSAGPLDAEQRRAAVWASKRADILIWCSTSYQLKEQQVWEGMPDTVKDNGFLFVTKTDLLGSRETAQTTVDRIEQRAGEEFRQVMPLSAKQARAALQAQGGVNTELFKESGAGAIISAIKSRVQMARRADTDMAELLLARHQETADFVAKRFAEPEDAPTDAVDADPQWRPPPEPQAEAAPEPVPQPVPVPEPVPEPQVEPVVRPEPQALADPAPKPQAEPPVSAPADPAEPLMVLARASDPGVARKRFTDRAKPEPLPDETTDPGTGRKRFADRIRAMPPPDDATAPMPLRSTWKSKSETAAPEPVAVAPAPAAPPPVARPPAPVVAAPLPPEPLPELEPALEPEVELEEPPAPVAVDEGSDSVAEDDPAEVEAATPVTDDDQTARVERAMPTNDAPLVERSAKTSLFGARRAPVPETPAPAARTVPGQRPGEPLVRVRAPGPRPPEPARPAAPPPEVLAAPRLVPGHERRPDSEGAAQRIERRERPRIAARAVEAPQAKVTAPDAPVKVVEQDVVAAAIASLVSRSVALAAEVDAADKLPVDLILDHARQTTELVMGQLARATAPELRRINSDLGEVLDLVMLMQLEKGHAPADDALTLLLQIRRDLETLRPA